MKEYQFPNRDAWLDAVWEYHWDRVSDQLDRDGRDEHATEPGESEESEASR